MKYDFVIKNAKIMDGSGTPWFKGDVAVRGDRIQKFGHLADTEACRVIDGTGKILTPGFIDTHTHLDLSPFPFYPSQDPGSVRRLLRNLTGTGHGENEERMAGAHLWHKLSGKGLLDGFRPVSAGTWKQAAGRKLCLLCGPWRHTSLCNGIRESSGFSGRNRKDAENPGSGHGRRCRGDEQRPDLCARCFRGNRRADRTVCSAEGL